LIYGAGKPFAFFSSALRLSPGASSVWIVCVEINISFCSFLLSDRTKHNIEGTDDKQGAKKSFQADARDMPWLAEPHRRQLYLKLITAKDVKTDILCASDGEPRTED
jgi:hypothetical protein